MLHVTWAGVFTGVLVLETPQSLQFTTIYNRLVHFPDHDFSLEGKVQIEETKLIVTRLSVAASG